MSDLCVRGFFGALVLFGLTTASFAEDWTAVRVRGEAFVYRDGWVKLERGDVVADDSIIRTLGRGRVSFERGAETIDLLPNSQIRILDQTGRKFTTVLNDYGGVEIDAEGHYVEHFSVVTPFLAAVVKGTRFTVTSADDGSDVSVERGQVRVESHSSDDSQVVSAGETASVSSSEVEVMVTKTLSPVAATNLSSSGTWASQESRSDEDPVSTTSASVEGPPPSPPPPPPEESDPPDDDDDDDDDD